MPLQRVVHLVETEPQSLHALLLARASVEGRARRRDDQHVGAGERPALMIHVAGEQREPRRRRRGIGAAVTLTTESFSEASVTTS